MFPRTNEHVFALHRPEWFVQRPRVAALGLEKFLEGGLGSLHTGEYIHVRLYNDQFRSIPKLCDCQHQLRAHLRAGRPYAPPLAEDSVFRPVPDHLHQVELVVAVSMRI